MARRKFPAFTSLWNKHVTHYINIFLFALQKLRKEKKITGNEGSISEILAYLLTDVCFKYNKKHDLDIPCPIWETPIRPAKRDEIKGGGNKQKRPDFSCFLRNPFAVSAEENEIPLHIECKRFSAVTSSNWDLNKQYVIEGI